MNNNELGTNLAEVGTDCSEFPNNSDTISRRAAIDAIDECYCGGEDSCGEPWIYKENAVEAINMIEPLPSAEPKKGKWIVKDDTERFIAQCNCCRYIEDSRRIKNFCPNCGAKMEVNHESN